MNTRDKTQQKSPPPGPEPAGVILHESGGMTLYGRDAVSLYAAITLRSGLRMYAKSGMKLSRNYTPSVMLAAAKEFTGKEYKRGQYQQAIEDLDTWIATMKAALPVTDERKTEAP